jgi:nucleoside-diphosphate-sugar epimerase
LISGGAGFIGSHLAERLVADGYEVTILDDLSSGKMQNLEHIRQHSLGFVKADINDQSTVLRALDGVDVVVHLAAIVSVHKSIIDPALVNRVNFVGTQNVLECVRKRNVDRIVFASSAAVYGNPDSLPISEDAELCPISPYGASKLSAERKILEYQDEFGFDATILRFFNVYGPRSSSDGYSGVIAKFASRLSNYEGPVIYGDGLQTRDFVYVDDIVQAIVLATRQRGQSNKRMHSIFNVGSGSHVKIEDLASLESSLVLGDKILIPFDYRPAVKEDIRDSYADISRIKRELGYNPKVKLEDGLKKYLSWFLQSNPVPAPAF